MANQRAAIRQLGNRFGSESYAAKELIAELGSAFLSSVLGLETEPRIDHAPYVADWRRILKNAKHAIFTAAGKAQQAVDWLSQQVAHQQKPHSTPLPFSLGW